MQETSSIERPFKIKTKEVIPLIELPSTKDIVISSWDLKQRKNLVIFFNHGMQCEKCKTKLMALKDIYDQLRELETEVLSISFDEIKKLKQEAEKNNLPYPLLSDNKKETTNKFTYIDPMKDAPYPSIFITDRYGELRKQEIAKEAYKLISEKEILSWLKLIETECPECSHL